MTQFALGQTTVPSADALTQEKDLEVAVGIDELQKVDFDYSPKISVGNENLLKLTLVPQRREIIFKGVKPGRTNVTIRDNVGDVRMIYNIIVTASGKSNIVSELRELIGDVEGLDISIKGGKVVVSGEIVVPDDIGRVSKVLANYQNDVLTLIELSPQTQRIIARKMADELTRNMLKDVTVRVVNKAYWLEGVVSSKSKRDLAEEIATSYLPPKISSLSAGDSRFQNVKDKPDIYNFIAINEKKEAQPPPKMVKITSQFVELSKGYNKVFGFKWAPLMGDDASSISFGQTTNGNITTSSSGTLSATITALFPKLLAAKGANYARVIQSGMIITRDNMPGTISKETTIPFAIGSGDFTKATEAKITFNLNVTPKILEQEQLEMAINLTISNQAGSSNGSPLITNNSINTNVILKSKESSAIGGIVQNNSTTQYDKDPFASTATTASGAQAVPLFRLLRSKDYQTSKNQYVIFVTPEIIESAAIGTEEIRKKFRRRAD